MIISIFETTELEKKHLQEKLKGHTLKFFEEPIQNIKESEYSDSNVISVFVHSKVTEAKITNCKDLKLVCTRSTGIDHIDKDYLEKQNIALKNVPLYGENTVAEHTFALMLALSRKINESYTNTINGIFSTDGLMGFDLKDKTIGIIGGGRIGLHVARMARSFGMHVRVYDIKEDNFLAEIINFKYLNLEELLKVSDIVSLHVPYNKYTHHMINEDSISKMKDGAILINTARGGVVKEEALVKALDEGWISGAALDVFEEEPTSNKALCNHPKVSVTPHIGGQTAEAQSRIGDEIVSIITSF